MPTSASTIGHAKLPAATEEKPQHSGKNLTATKSAQILCGFVHSEMELDPESLPIPQSFKCPLTLEVRGLRGWMQGLR